MWRQIRPDRVQSGGGRLHHLAGGKPPRRGPGTRRLHVDAPASSLVLARSSPALPVRHLLLHPDRPPFLIWAGGHSGLACSTFAPVAASVESVQDQLESADRSTTALRHYVRRTIRLTKQELRTLEAREAEICRKFPIESMESRDEREQFGLAIFDLRINPSKWKYHSGGKMEIELVRSSNSLIQSRTFKVGKAVDLFLDESSDRPESEDPFLIRSPPSAERKEGKTRWNHVVGVICGATSNSLHVRIRSLANFVVDALGHGNPHSPRNRVYIQRQDESAILSKSVKVLRAFEKMNNVSPVSKYIFPQLNVDKFPNSTGRPQSPYHSAPVVTPNTIAPNSYQPVVFDPNLDSAKQHVLKQCAERRPVTVVHGPPGTGKTTALAAAILSAVANGERVLAVGPSHASCDALIMATARHWPTEDTRFGPADQGNLIRMGDELTVTMPEVKQFLPRPVNRNLEKELKLLRRELTGVEGHHRKHRGDLLKAESTLVQNIQKDERKHEKHLLAEAKVVICTNYNASRTFVQFKNDFNFDVVFFDEAGFCNDYQVLPLLGLAPRAVMGGDHLQLPPPVLSKATKEQGLDISLFERIVKAMPETVNLLNVQYRSNQLISDWSSIYFYKNRLTTHSSVADICLQDLDDSIEKTTETETPLLFVDTAGENYHEEESPEEAFSTPMTKIIEESMSNYNEAFVVELVVKKFLSLGVDPRDIGVISPYWAQVGLLRTLLWAPQQSEQVEVRTVDGFQGREKEVIVLSFVRSNPDRVVGFLSESRRINVSVTRAKRCLVAVGDSSTLMADPALRSFVKYCWRKKASVPVNSIM